MLYLAIIFLSAFLLFQVQPLIAKLILPFFGGGAAIWTACLLFFQAFLLLGYFYSHCLTQLKSVKMQLSIHLGLIALSLLTLPIGMSLFTYVSPTTAPLLSILLLLTSSIGLPYFVLSSTGPLIQRWLTYVEVGKLPYQLYSLSNVGSLLALLSFPFVFEPLLSTTQQSIYWTVGYGIFAGLIITLLWKMSQLSLTTSVDTKPMENNHSNHGIRLIDKVLWISLAMVGVIILVATTNAMTQNIPPVPFLWILPLCLYLLTFIVSFHSPKWYVREYWFALFVLTACLALLMHFIGSQFDIVSQVIIYSCILFIACMICHGELARLKPAVEKLTLYYLFISLGGFLGSAFVAFIAQNIFEQFLEFPLAIISVFVLLALSVFIQLDKHVKKQTWLIPINIILAVSFTLGLVYLNTLFIKTNVFSERNFYGILSVKDVEINGKIQRRLIDGTTSHGTQSLASGEAKTPRSYYRKNTGVALTIEQLTRQRVLKGQSLNAGFVGLGAGTLAAYASAGDDYIFYELNPAVISAAQNYFSYLADSAANIELVQGDGRVSLQKQLDSDGSQQFDLLVIDAFSGDSIPQHLLTQEALALYFKHLKQDGILVVHISNTHLNLIPLVRGLANVLDKDIVYVKTKAKGSEEHDAQWVMLTNNQDFLNDARLKVYLSAWPRENSVEDNLIIWSDEHSDLLSVLK
ncbi:MAG: fused MFS/spermidine synthase [Colwellia sp.]|nr:fused MFS/spermidine synthase [Colwellia sp.]